MAGSNAILVIARFAQRSSTFTQLELLLVISLLYQSPPVTPPAQTFLPEMSLGSHASALVLPPTLLGPSSFQLVSTLVLSPGIRGLTTLALDTDVKWLFFISSVNTSGVGRSKEGSIVLKKSCS